MHGAGVEPGHLDEGLVLELLELTELVGQSLCRVDRLPRFDCSLRAVGGEDLPVRSVRAWGFEARQAQERATAASQWVERPAEHYRAYCREVRRFADALARKEQALARFSRQIAALNRAHVYCLRLYRDTIEALRLSETMPHYWRTDPAPFTDAALAPYHASLPGQRERYSELQAQIGLAFEERGRLENALQARYQSD